MIYNWNNVDPSKIVRVPLQKPEATSLGLQLDDKRQYFTALVPGSVLVDQQGKYVHPTAGDVFVVKEELFGLERVLQAKKVGYEWSFTLAFRLMEKSEFGAPKTFARPMA